MPDIVLKIIPKPKEGTRTVLKPPKGPAVRGKGNLTYICGNSRCGSPLLEKVGEGQVSSVVIKCPRCGMCNEKLWDRTWYPSYTAHFSDIDSLRKGKTWSPRHLVVDLVIRRWEWERGWFGSDGLSEVYNHKGEFFGEERIRSTFTNVADKTPTQIIKHLSDAAEKWTNKSTLQDDMTLLVMKVK